MPLSFPSSPSVGATSTQNGRSYTYAGNNVWELTAPTGGGGGGSLSATVTIPGLGDPYYDSVSLLLHMDGTGGTFVDSSGTPKTVTANGSATQSTSQSKFGGSSFQGGAGKYLTVNGGSGFQFGTGDFALEFYAYPTETPAGSGLISSDYAGGQVGFTVAFSNSGTLGSVSGSTLFFGYYESGSWKGVSSGATLTLNAWNHIAVSRISATYSLYLNGTRLGTYWNSSAMPDMQPIRIGTDWGATSSTAGNFIGFIDELRITKGSGRALTGETIAVPTSAYLNSTSLTVPVVFATPTVTISSQPSNQTASSGAATFSVTASVTLGGTLTYQWQRSTNSGSTWADVSGATSSSLALSSQTSTNNGDQYRVVVSSAGATSVTSSAATLTVASSFTPTAVLLTTGTSYSVPANASSMKAWAVGGGGANGGVAKCGGAGGTAYKTWSVSGGASVAYSVGDGGLAYSLSSSSLAGGNTTVTFSGTTITGNGGAGDTNGGSPGGGSYSGGDGGVSGGSGSGDFWGSSTGYGGAVGGNGTPVATCNRKPMTDVSGLKAALALAGISTSETCGATAAFGSGCAGNKYGSVSAGIGGGGAGAGLYSLSGYGPKRAGGSGAVILYFT